MGSASHLKGISRRLALKSGRLPVVLPIMVSGLRPVATVAAFRFTMGAL